MLSIGHSLREKHLDRINLDQAYWIGGSPCSGKSSISRLLADRYGLALYEVDASLPRLLPRLDPQRHPTLLRWTSTAWEELWMQPQQALLEQAIAAYSEHFSLILDELVNSVVEQPLLVEGTALLPGLVQTYLASLPRAIWVVPSEGFQRRMYPQRGDWVQGILASCSQPQTAFQNWMDRDAAFARWVFAETARLDLPSLVVEDSSTTDQNADRIAELFGLGQYMASP